MASGFMEPNWLSSFNVSISRSFSISTKRTKISAVAPASSTARWWFSKEIFSAFATTFNLYLERVGNKTLASATVSREMNSRSISWYLQFCSMKLTSNPALWATRTASPIKSRNFGSTTSIVSASTTISSVILVSCVILNGIGILGLTKVLNRSVITPLSTLTAPISMILSWIGLNPVVSRSKTT